MAPKSKASKGGSSSSDAAAKGADASGKGGAAGAAADKGAVKEVKVRSKAFRVQVHIIEVKDIKPQAGGLPDLVVTASVGKFGTKYTQVVRQATAGQFDTFLEWKFTATFEQMNASDLVLRVLNANTDAKSEPLGMYSLPLSQIRKQPLGEYFMTWLALYTDPDEYVTELSGALRATITCLGGAQQVPTHSEEEIEEALVDDNPPMLMPHRVRWAHYSLLVAIYRIEGLPNMDEYGSTDAFVSIKLPGQAALKSKVVRNSLDPVFNELLRFPVQLPIMYDTLTISVSDFDQGGYDDLVADATFSLNEIVAQKELKPHWIPLYGIAGKVGLQEIREKLPPSTPLDTCYKGRLLVGIMAEEVSTRVTPKVKGISPCSDPPSEPFIIRFDLYQASQLDERSVPDNTQIEVELQVGGLIMTSTTGLAEHGQIRWDEQFKEERIYLPSDMSQCPDIFINVYYTTTNSAHAERLGYIRLDLEDVCGFNHARCWETLLRDPLFPHVSAVPGFIEYRLDFGKEADMPKSARERMSQPPMRKFELRGHIYQARNLPSMDEDGLANPYVCVTLQGFAGQTRVAEPTCNPLFYETVRVELLLPQPTPITSQILLRVYDQEEGEAVGGDQLIGKAFFPLLGVDKAFPPRPEWVSIWMDNPQDTRGELLCSFQLIAAEDLAKVPLNDITPPMRDVEVEVNVVGVRELLAYNNAPIIQPFVELDAGDRSTPDRVRKTNTSSQPSGPDANFLETLVIHTRLPEDLLFCPSLNVRVFDYRGADNTPVIGKVAIPLAPYCEWISEAEYVSNNRPREPLYKISDELSEASDEEEKLVDHDHANAKARVPADLFQANFNFEPEMVLDTMSAAELKLNARRGRTGKGQRVRTIPPTEPIVPFELYPCEPDEEAKIEKPLDSELEHIIVDPPFDEWQVYRGTSAGPSGGARRQVGRFKARLRVIEADLKSDALPKLDLADLFEQAVYVTRVYVTKGIKLSSRDSDGLADPYLVVSNGTQKHNVFDDVKHVKLDTLNPNFYRCYELPTLIPGNPTLTIEVWDKDMSGSTLIGSTSLDLENRLLSEEWIKMETKPVERRYLWSPASLAPQGKLEMWVEVLTPPQALASKPKVLRAPSALDCQLRVVVWGVHDLVTKGKSSAIQRVESADVFVTAHTGGAGRTEETDVHHGVVEYAEFNYRFLFDIALPTRSTKLYVQVWDTRATGANDALAECVLQLHTLFANVQAAQRRIHEVPKQFYSLTHPLHAGAQGKVELSIALMPRSIAEELEHIAGIGRGAPNQNPYLPPPNRAPQNRGAGMARYSLLRGSSKKEEELGFNSALRGRASSAPPPGASVSNAPPMSKADRKREARALKRERARELKAGKKRSSSADSVGSGSQPPPPKGRVSGLFGRFRRGRSSAGSRQSSAGAYPGAESATANGDGRV